MTLAERTPPAAWRAGLGRRLGRVVVPSVYHCVVRGRDHVPAEGPLVLVANHSGMLDGPLVMSLAPRAVTFLVKQEMFHGGVGSVLRGVGQIPIDRTTGDRRALDAARAVLARGGVVGVFPEGTRGAGDVQQVNQGATWLALQTGARVVPVCVLGTRVAGRSADALPRVRARVVADFGQPFDLEVDPALPGRARLVSATDLLRERLAAHVARATASDGARPVVDPPRPPPV
ncbi:MAG: 1-acyl-sn-glycerol-3-phosphate acyltransferase [Actinomycetota bacterium]|nr:1-acyl-sn-glycerol-3-phosphate acyltransferase [Actinomycetota bacterium]